MNLEQLLGILSDYRSGDLVKAVELLDHCEALLNDGGLPDEQRQVLLEVKEYLASEVTGDVSAGADQIKKLYEKLDSTASPKPKPEKPIEKEEQGIAQDMDVLMSFIYEAQDHLEHIEDQILQIEGTDDVELLNGIFRSLHTIKGVSSFIGLSKIQELSHLLESVLDGLRTQEIESSSDLIDVLLEGIDYLQRLVAELDEDARSVAEGKTKGPVTEADVDISRTSSRKRDILEKEKTEETVYKKSHTDKLTEKDAGTEEGRPDFLEDLATPEMIDKFVEESIDLLDQAEEDIIEIEKAQDKLKLVDQAFRAIHTVKGNAGFFWFTEIEQTCMSIESVLDALRKGDRQVDSGVVNVLLQGIDGVRAALVSLQAGGSKNNQQKETGPDDEHNYSRNAEPLSPEEDKPIGEVLISMGVIDEENIEQALAKQRKKLGEILVDEGKVKKEDLEKALDMQGAAASDTEKSTSYSIKRKDIRVDTTRLDRLFDLMGELITAEAMLIGAPEFQALNVDSIDKAAGNLNKITRELQEITMSIRMIPLDGLFNKMRRLVRDLSRKFSKEVNLYISGGDTEMDRNVMEEVSDPLVHIIRNAIDHGIENKEERKRKGKNPEGSIFLNAKHEGNEIWISVKDDGAGLNKGKILAKAEQQGLIKTDASKLTDEEIWKLIFHPGFSTADRVSEISGRGVGMDVVNQNLEKLRGKVDLQSVEGEGSEIVMKIPLTLAIIDAVTVQAGDMHYCVPIHDVKQFHKHTLSQITKTGNGQRVLNLRREIIPVISLSTFFNRGNVTAEEDGIMVIVQARGKKAAVLVDEILGYRQVVIKALPEYLGTMRATSGCTILGDGSISLILDTGALVQTVLE